jgi:2-dehydro-3-deoxyphosphogluconate aldolase/(4S)-4-hydroxy-2-oxoglutarate aldolase
MRDIDSILAAAPVIPVLVIDRAEDALPIAHALVEGGLPVLEVTLRTPVALEATPHRSVAAHDRRRPGSDGCV